ncbi:DUF2637 domain-containing protein [Kutzneria chonburiensis]|uniref:DUF2637 domain-containing protein n=1 Tax=Kutzneria chonburiensis TaxID=1483604 RepID=A0ABV6N784_9PSEU|nr:DUF2637 domain-containing protein [Kutzneria chonburiensis]
MNVPDRTQRLSRCQIVVIVFAIVLGLALACYGAAGSYETIREQADQRGLPLPFLVPVGIDGGLIGAVVLDLLLAWTAQPLGWLRQLSRVLTVGTVVANAVAGWPDLVAVGLHAAAPVMLLAMVEAGRAALLRRLGVARSNSLDPIPTFRWLLSPSRTWLLWRRMTLWQVTSYHAALDAELTLRRAVAQLRVRYGRPWARCVPADLVWMLRSGVFLDEAYATVAALTSGPDTAPLVGEVAGPVGDVEFQQDTPARVDQDQLDEVVQLNQRHWAHHGRPVSAETVRKHLGIGAEKAADRDALRNL